MVFHRNPRPNYPQPPPDSFLILCTYEVLRFARDPSVPATNNLAERLLRLYKVQQKISGCYRSVAGAVAQANLRTMLETARMQGWNVLETIEAGPAAASTKLKTS